MPGPICIPRRWNACASPSGWRGRLGYRLKIFDAYRPVEGQWALWNASPDPEFVADPSKGGPHNRGVALDLTLIDAQRARSWTWGPASMP